MFKTVYNLFLFTIALNSLLLSQPEMGQFEGKIDGHVYDLVSKLPLEYANIVVFNLRDSPQVNGTITNSEGYFSLDINDLECTTFVLDSSVLRIYLKIQL